MTGESIIVAIVAGLFVGWLVGLIAQGNELGIVGNLTMAAFGGIVGEWLLPMLSFVSGRGIMTESVCAAVGAAVMLLAIKIVASEDDRPRFKQDGRP